MQRNRSRGARGRSGYTAAAVGKGCCPHCGEPKRVKGADGRWRNTHFVPAGPKGLRRARLEEKRCPVVQVLEPVGADGPGGKPGVLRSERLHKALVERDAAKRRRRRRRRA